jgi:rhomboid protease GluP
MKLNHKPPLATAIVLAVTGLATSLQLASPRLLALLERTPDALARHQWWRLVTPLFVHADGLRQIAFNFTAILIVGVIVERIFGSRLWLLIYFVSGIVGEIAGFAWQPQGAGASVAGAGLLGALAAWLLLINKRPQAIFGAAVILLGAISLTTIRDLHGPPILTGACIAATSFWLRKQ